MNKQKRDACKLPLTDKDGWEPPLGKAMTPALIGVRRGTSSLRRRAVARGRTLAPWGKFSRAEMTKLPRRGNLKRHPPCFVPLLPQTKQGGLQPKIKLLEYHWSHMQVSLLHMLHTQRKTLIPRHSDPGALPTQRSRAMW